MGCHWVPSWPADKLA